MRYFQFAFDGSSGSERYQGVLTLVADHFPSQKELKTLLCDGRVTALKGRADNTYMGFPSILVCDGRVTELKRHKDDINIYFPSIFEFKNKKDFDSWCSGGV